MKKLLEFIRIKLSKLKKGESQVNRGSTLPTRGKADRFIFISWVVTVLIVASMLFSALWWKSTQSVNALAPVPTAATGENPPKVVLPVPVAVGNGAPAIERDLQLKTNIPERPRYKPVKYHVLRGEGMSAIADKFKIKLESILYVNNVKDDNPFRIKPGDELLIPPVDGIYYEWKDGDTFEKIAERFNIKADDIINFPGNNIDLTNPKVEAGTMVMIPGGSRELKPREGNLTTVSRSNNGSTGTSDFGGTSCSGGPVASGFGWPADDHSLSGNSYGPGHLGIDIAAPEGANIYAAGSGIVTMAQGGSNYGYGNVVMIDHGGCYVTVYAHLSSFIVSVGESVGQGTLIGYSGATGNAFGAHLHFEIRVGGANINPYEIVQ